MDVRSKVIRMLSRRAILAMSTIAATGLPLAVRAQQGKAPASISAAELSTPGPLGEVVVGKADAPVTVIEYASLTCSHCARFHNETYPAFKAKYVDTGKVKFILREFPIDQLATAGFMIARCAGENRYHPVVDLLFQQQRNWAFVDKPFSALVAVLRQAGFTQESVDACLKRNEIYDGVMAVRNRGAEKLGVDSTPTFFINGQVHRGALSIEELDKIIGPLVGS